MSGLQLFFSEQIEPNDKLKERVNNLAKTIIIIYALFPFFFVQIYFVLKCLTIIKKTFSNL